MFLYEVVSYNVSFMLTMAVPFIAGYFALGKVYKFETEFDHFVSYFGGVVLFSLLLITFFDAITYLTDSKSIIKGLNALTAYLMLSLSALVWGIVSVIARQFYIWVKK